MLLLMFIGLSVEFKTLINRGIRLVNQNVLKNYTKVVVSSYEKFCKPTKIYLNILFVELHLKFRYVFYLIGISRSVKHVLLFSGNV